MLSLYLAALIFGFGTFAVQMLFSSDSGGDGHAPPEFDVAGGHSGDLHLDAGDAHAGQGEHSSAAAHVGDWASVVLSLRFYMFASMGLGIVGAPVTWLGLAGSSATLLASCLTALIVGFAGAWTFRALGRQTLSSGASRGDLVGQVGRVLLACDRERRGKVRLQVRGQTLDFLATTDAIRLEPGATIIVQEVGSDGLVVCEAPRELSSDWQAPGDA